MANQIGQRWADDDFQALQIAQAIETAGGEVFTISYRGMGKYASAIDPHAQYIVWFKLPQDKSFDYVDACIARIL